MGHTPHSILKKLGTVLVACTLATLAVFAVATPARAADSKTYGNLTFSSSESLEGIMSDAEGEVVVSGASDIVVTPATAPDGVDITSLVIGGEGDDAYSGSITFNGVTLNPVAITINSANVEFNNCSLTGSDKAPTIVSLGASAIEFAGTNTLNGGAGKSGENPTVGTAALRATGTTAISVSGEMTVEGGAGGNPDATLGTPTTGGAGIYAPTATLSMESGKLTVKAGNTYTGNPVNTPADLPVGLTIGTFDLSNGTGEAGKGPEVTAIGWPTANSKPLPVDGFKAGSADDNTFYPWLLQVSGSLDGSDPYLIDFAGSGNTEPITREGWRWFNIAPHPVTGLDVSFIGRSDVATAGLVNVVNQVPGRSVAIPFTLGVSPTFNGVEDLIAFGWMEGASVSNPTAEPANAVQWSGADGSFTVAPSFTGESIEFSGTAVLPSSFTSLYPNLPTSLSTSVPVGNVKAVYRLYNPYNGCHLYSTTPNEVKTCADAGMTYEGPIWLQPATPIAGDSTIVRMYNPYSEDHFYVPESNEALIAELKGYGWKQDGEAANLISIPKADGVPVTMLFNRYTTRDTHLWTPNPSEVAFLSEAGWQDQGAYIYALALTQSL